MRHLALPKPGDWRQLCILLSRLQARGLDMKRPLWEAYVIEGLSGVDGLPKNSFAIMIKIHHAAIDGISGAEIMTAIHNLTDEVEPPLVEDEWQGRTRAIGLVRLVPCLPAQSAAAGKVFRDREPPGTGGDPRQSRKRRAPSRPAQADG